MSISSLVDEELVRKGTVTMTFGTGDQKTEPKTSAAFEALARYIPTEVVTLYIAAASAMGALKKALPAINEVNTYWFFVVITPLVFLIVFAGKRLANGETALPGISDWPWWKLFAATFAFSIWALAVPTAPYLTGVEGGAVAAFFATFVSVLLSMLAPIFERKKK